MNKICTSIEQSKKLLELGIDRKSSDMFYWYGENIIRIGGYESQSDYFDIPAWSLAALLAIVPDEVEIGGQRYAPCLFPVNNGRWIYKLWYNSDDIFTSPISIFEDNLIDVCYKMIIKLHDLKIL